MLCLLVNIGFQVLFHSPPGVLFNFPSRYYFTIGHQGVFSLGGWSPLLPTRFLVSCRTLESTYVFADFAYWTFTVSGMLSQNISAIGLESILVVLNPKGITTFGLGFSAFARHYLQNRFFSLFSCGYLDVSVPHVSPPIHYLFMYGYHSFIYDRFPHSDTHDSSDICSLSWIFAACRVLLRLLMPRHSPYALISLT